MKTIKRDKCVICDNNLKEIYTFNDFPIYMGVSNNPYLSDVMCDMVFCECVECGCVQLNNLIPLDILYATPHNAAVGKTWDDHHKEFSKFMSKYINGDVIEIGGGNLILAKHLEHNRNINSITVYDTNSYGEYKSDKIELTQTFFNSKSIETKVDAVIHSHLLEHFYDPIGEMGGIYDILKDDGHTIISVPLVDEMLKDKFTSAMNFEHTYMTTYDLVERMLNVSGFNITDSVNFNPYTVFIVAEKGEKKENNSKCEHGTDVFKEFIDYHTKLIIDINQKIKSIDAPKENVFVFGAHIFTQYLFEFGLDSKLFTNILDNDDNKIDSRLYGTDLIVASPKILKDIRYPVVVLKAAQYTEEIKKDILDNINPSTIFIL